MCSVFHTCASVFHINHPNPYFTRAALHEVSLLQQELEDVRAVKKQREEQLLAAKKQITEVQYELSKAQVRVICVCAYVCVCVCMCVEY